MMEKVQIRRYVMTLFEDPLIKDNVCQNHKIVIICTIMKKVDFRTADEAVIQKEFMKAIEDFEPVFQKEAKAPVVENSVEPSGSNVPQTPLPMELVMELARRVAREWYLESQKE